MHSHLYIYVIPDLTIQTENKALKKTYQSVARSILGKSKPVCITEQNKTELVWEQVFQQNFCEVDGLQLCPQRP